MSIFIGEGLIDYSAMQGPCADGYHVPLKDEWDNLYGILTNTFGLPSNTSTFKTYLKMPLAGYRDNNGSITYQGSIGCYWTSSYSNTNWTWAYYFNIEEREGYTGVRAAGATANGYSIRPFKNTPVEPDNTWTTLYDGSSTVPGAGVFRNSSLGIMSISGDGNTWITIADKNLGAKVTYGGNAAVSTNSGNYYQWGNNYGFPFTGGITTSSTQVDATNYGPGNYYESSTFITRSTTPFGWDSSTNQNLRGGVTGVVKKSNIKDIFIGEGVDDYSAMQGPCADGYHVPLKDEWTGLKSIMEALSLSTSTGYPIYLHIPKCGQRSFSGGAVQNSGEARYSCCDGRILSIGKYINGGLGTVGDVISISSSPSVVGLSIRPFKNKAIVPNSSWTTIYQGTGDAGIFWNISEGIISLSSDGTNWITIADKNLGATQVYNNGDILSEANCGKFYQRGNNYGFPFTGGITTSSTKVDDSNYGPGNYYSSSTFIITSGAPYQWGTSDNLNLRGGVTGVVKKGNVKEVYVGTTKVRPSGWKPGANTLIYCPLTSDYTDHSGNSNTINIKYTPTLTTYGGVACAYLGQLVCLYTDILSLTKYTMSVWVNHQGGKGSEWVILAQGKNTGVGSGVWGGLYQSKFTASIVNVGYSTQYTVDYTGWHLVTFTRNGNDFKMYWDGVYKGTYNDTYTSDYRFGINAFYNFDNANHQGKGYYSNWIVENKVRTDQEVADYYNLTKGNYGL